jgi:hypothetical protein
MGCRTGDKDLAHRVNVETRDILEEVGLMCLVSAPTDRKLDPSRAHRRCLSGDLSEDGKAGGQANQADTESHEFLRGGGK